MDVNKYKVINSADALEVLKISVGLSKPVALSTLTSTTDAATRASMSVQTSDKPTELTTRPGAVKNWTSKEIPLTSGLSGTVSRYNNGQNTMSFNSKILVCKNHLFFSEIL